MQTLVYAIIAAVLLVVAPPGWTRQADPFVGTVAPIPADVAAEMTGVSWRPGCPVPLGDLRLVEVSHHGFDGAVHVGVLVVHADVAESTVRVFRRLYEVGFPFRSMHRVESYGGSDDASMAAGNTSAFNCRPSTGSSTGFSVHAYGRAFDLNTVENPYVRGELVLPAAGRDYLDRGNVRPGMVVAGGVVTSAFAGEGFTWGGDWTSLKDYQHFERSTSSS